MTRERALFGEKVGRLFKRFSPGGTNSRRTFVGLIRRDAAQTAVNFKTAELLPVEKQAPRQFG